MRRSILALAAASALSVAGAANAAAISGLYSTGVDDNGTVLAPGSADPHWSVDGAGTPVVYTNPKYAGASDAAFISVQPDGGYSVNPNTYALNFDLPSDFGSAQISGNFEADNYATAYLNGVAIGQDVQGTVFPNFQSETPFSATTGFRAGENTLSFVVTDTGPPSALEVSSLAGTVSAAPEPSTWALMFAGLAGIGLMLRRAKKTMGFRFRDAFAA